MKIGFSVTWTPVLAAALVVWKCSYWIMRYETLQQGFYLFSDRCKESSTTPTNYCLGLRYYVGVCKYAKEEVRKINVWKMKIMCNYPWDGVGFWGIEMSPRDPLDWADPWDGVDCWGIEISPRRDPWDGVALGDPWDRVDCWGIEISPRDPVDRVDPWDGVHLKIISLQWGIKMSPWVVFIENKSYFVAIEVDLARGTRPLESGRWDVIRSTVLLWNTTCSLKNSCIVCEFILSSLLLLRSSHSSIMK